MLESSATNEARTIDVTTGQRGGFIASAVGLWTLIGLLNAAFLGSSAPAATVAIGVLAVLSWTYVFYAFCRKITLSVSRDLLALRCKLLGITLWQRILTNPKSPSIYRELGENKGIEFRIVCDNGEICWGGISKDKGFSISQAVGTLLDQTFRELPRSNDPYRGPGPAGVQVSSWPSSEPHWERLALAFDFRPHDLQLNRSGELSEAQKRRLAIARRQYWTTCILRYGTFLVLGSLVFAFSFRLLQQDSSSQQVLGAAIVGGLIAILGFGGIVQSSVRIAELSRDMRDAKVSSVQGRVQKRLVGGKDGGFRLFVDGLWFPSPSDDACALLEEGKAYRLYFAANSKTLLAVEPG